MCVLRNLSFSFLALAIGFCIQLYGADVAQAQAPVSARVVDGAPAAADELYSTVAVFLDPAVFLGPGAAGSEPSPAWTNCTGTLISPRVVLSAAHCMRLIDLFSQEVLEPGPEDFRIAAGYRTDADFDQAQVVEVDEIIIHEGYADFAQICDVVDCFSLPPYDVPGLARLDDIALMILSEPVTNIPYTQIAPPEVEVADIPIALDELLPNVPLLVSGYGVTSVGSSNTGDLFIGISGVETVTDTQILTETTETHPSDSCNGDSGGPLYYSLFGDFYVVGITSYGRLDVPVVCGAGGVYTFPTFYLDWIRTNAGELFIEDGCPNVLCDFTECTVPECDSVEGCSTSPVADGTPCQEPFGGTCQAGVCEIRTPTKIASKSRCSIEWSERSGLPGLPLTLALISLFAIAGRRRSRS